MILKGFEMYAASGLPITQATVKLLAGSDVQPNAGSVLQTTSTDVNGMWQFTGLADGNYDVKVEVPGVNQVKWYKGNSQIALGSISAGSAMVKLAQTVLGSATASITFSSIPATYESLMVLFHGRGDNATQQVDLWLRCNGDTSGNYIGQESAAQATSNVASELISSKIRLGYIPANTANAGLFGSNRLMIPGYARTVAYKGVLAEGGEAHTFTTGGFTRSNTAAWWLNAAAITQLQLLPSAGNFIAGTVATLYGLPA